MPKIVIIGAGPTGLAAAYRFKELGHEDFVIYERNPYVGGLCASFKDECGFTWDLGGHVIFSRFPYFDNLLKENLKEAAIRHKREAWIFMQGTWIPYPFQNHLNHLPEPILTECLEGLRQVRPNGKCRNFEEWIYGHLGPGIARHFMVPYNSKIWTCPLHLLNTAWIDERVSQITFQDVQARMHSGEDKTDWGPNTSFQYPYAGGVREIFQNIALPLADKIRLGVGIRRIDTKKKSLYLTSEETTSYDVLINSSPLNTFLTMMHPLPADLLEAAGDLKFNRVMIIGIGIQRPSPSSKCWIYFPEDTYPFYRVTYLSNYSLNNVPDKKHFSLLCECAFPSGNGFLKTEDLWDRTVRGLMHSGLIQKDDLDWVVSRFMYSIDHAYPIPTINRDTALKAILPLLEKRDIFSRGRFGAWKYEIGNMDHSVMQGKEIVDRLLGIGPEEVYRL